MRKESVLFSWEPISLSGSGYETHHYEKRDNKLMPFPSGITTLLGGLFALCSAILLLDPMQGNEGLGYLLVCMFTATVGFVMMSASDKALFNKSNNSFQRNAFCLSKDLENAHCLQILEKEIDRPNKWFLCYELNLVMKDGSRINILNHANYDSIVNSANEIALFTGLNIVEKS